MPHPMAQVLRPFRELTVNQVIMLAVVYDGPATVRGIAATMGVSKSFITRGADKFRRYWPGEAARGSGRSPLNSH